MFDEMMGAIDARPDNFGPMRDANAHARYEGPCGDTAEMWLRIDGGRIRKATFMTDGCAPSVACCAAAARLVEGMAVERAKQLSQQEVLDVSGAIPPDHHHCALLAATTIQSAVLDWALQPEKPSLIERFKRKLKRNCVMKKMFPIYILVFALASLLNAAEPPKDSPPNIIWIEADDLMPRFMNKLGEGFGYTPNLDRLATQGVYFPNAVCQGPMCGPSRNGLLTNLYSHNLGFYRNGNMRYLPKGVWTFPTELQKVGYQTAYVGKSHIRPRPEDPTVSKSEGLEALGFDYALCVGERAAIYSALKRGKDVSDIPFIQYLKKRGKYEQFLADNKEPDTLSTMEEDVDYLDGFATQVAVDWLSKGRDSKKPFFMWFNFCLPHGPYNVPQRWYDKVADLKIPPPKTDSFGHEVPEPLLVDNRPAKEGEAMAKIRMGEAANVAFMDAQIGRLLDTLESTGQLDNTVVIFFSDHSIFMGNHGRMHKGTLFEEALKTSMIISFPKCLPQDEVNTQPMELMDLVPTTFEFAGIKNPNQVAKNGISILPALGEKGSNGRKYAFSEILGAQAASGVRFRYITCEGQEFLYDHETDPWEMKNVADEFPEVTAQMREAVKKWMETTGPVNPPRTY